MPAPISLDALPQLDDRDVTFLYEIISSAQQSRQRPVKALFTAYDEVLQQHGAQADHDSKYFRFLSHASSELAKDGTQGLVRRFRHLLSQFGIQLVLEGGIDEFSPAQQHAQTRPRRRASFNDSNLDATWASRLSHTAAWDYSDDRAASSLPKHSGHRRAVSATRTEGISHAHLHSPPLLAWVDRPDKQQLSHEAMQFLLETLARKCLWTWHSRAVQTRRRQQDLLHIASNHDKRTLLKQSFLQMKGGTFESRFWQQQERRAGRARDLYLLTKAFTHWAQAASDEVLRTSLARRHILRTRYFNAWRDITAINELKCRRVALLKWFNRWRSRSVTITNNDQNATDKRRNALLKVSYWTWFWSFCERKAPIWNNVRFKSAALDTWRGKLYHVREMALAADGRHNCALQKGALVILQGRLLRQQDDNIIAFDSARTRLLCKALTTMRRKIKLQPREVRFNADYDARLKNGAFNCWQTKVRLSQQATSINLQRLQANALTLWNDQLRHQVLRFQIDDRIVVQALYRWVLQQRLALFLRVMDYRQKQSNFQLFLNQTAARRFQLHEATLLLQANQERRQLRSNFVKLYNRFRAVEQQNLEAVEVYNARAAPRAFSTWRATSAEHRKLSMWATQARFYCLTHSAIKRWQEAIAVSQRRRRREAYASVRQRQKASLARECLERLKHKAALLHDHQLQAQRKSELASATMARFCLDQLMIRANQWQADSLTATRISDSSRLHDAFTNLLARYEDHTELEMQAQSFAADAVDRSARKMVRRLLTIDFNLRRNIETAKAWHDRRFLQRRQAILRRWTRKAFDLRDTRILQDVDSPSRMGPSVSVLGYDIHVDQSHNDINAAPTPSFLLRTPSRRRNRPRFATTAARLAGAQPAETTLPLDFGSSVLASTTPAPLAAAPMTTLGSLTPHITPFQRKLRTGGLTSATTTPQSVVGDTPYGGASSLLLRGLTRTPQSAALVPRTDRAVRFGRADLDHISDEEAQEEEDEDAEADESPSRPRP